MAFSLACDSGKTTLRIEGTDTDVLWDDVVNAGAGSVAVDGGGTEDPSFFVTEYIVDTYYTILKNIEFGDGTNTLSFLSKAEAVYYNDDCSWQVQANATLNIGDIYEDYGQDGTYWNFDFEAYWGGTPLLANSVYATLNISGSLFYHRGGDSDNDRMYIPNGTVSIVNSLLGSNVATSFGVFYFGTNSTWSMEDVYISNCYGVYVDSAPVSLVDVWFHNCNAGIYDYVAGTVRVNNLGFSDGRIAIISGTGTILEFANPKEHFTAADFYIATGDDPTIKEVYETDLLIQDSESNGIEGATVEHLISSSTDGGTTWGAYSYVDTYTTDSDGLTGEQDYYYAQWVTSAETETLYQHRLEVSAPGHNSFTINNIRPDDESLSLQFQKDRGIFYHGSRRRISF